MTARARPRASCQQDRDGRTFERKEGTRTIQNRDRGRRSGREAGGQVPRRAHRQQTQLFGAFEKAVDKTSTLTGALSRLMPNIDGPRSIARRLLMSVTHSILLYGAEIWAERMAIGRIRSLLLRVQRSGALRICSAYRSVSTEAALLIAGTIPIDYLALERRHIFKRSREGENRDAVKNEERMKTIQQWQTRWSSETVGAWTRTLIPTIQAWIDREHGECSFHLTQFLTGHGGFNEYLYKRNLKTTPRCDYCFHESDNALHTVFQCSRWDEQRSQLTNELEREINPTNIVPLMLDSETNWSLIRKFIEKILRTKDDKERTREGERRH